jgi:hypothetical protein
MALVRWRSAKVAGEIKEKNYSDSGPEEVG